MVYLLGLCCVAWTIVELVGLSEPGTRTPRPSPQRPTQRPGVGSRRIPLAAWDEQGRPVFVEDVTIRGAR